MARIHRPAAAHLPPWLPAAAVIVTLLASLTVPLFVFERINRYDRAISDVAVPARSELDALLSTFITQLSSLRGYLLTGEGNFLETYRQARQDELMSLRKLRSRLGEIGPRPAGHLMALEEALARWHEQDDLLLRGDLPREDYITDLPNMQQRLDAIRAQVALLNEVLLSYETEQRATMERALRNGGITIGILNLVGLIAAIGIAWISYHFAGYSVEIERRAEEELALRNLAAALNGARESDAVLTLITESAMTMTLAAGAYIERICEDRQNVEVVVCSGKGIPSRGTVIPYPGSLTEQILATRQPLLASSVKEIGPAIAGNLEERCPQCELIVVPLISEDRELGALVLVRPLPSSKRFGESDLRRGKVLGDLAAVAIRRVALLERERRSRALAEEAVQARDEVVGIVSHDLRGPLTTIALATQLIGQVPGTEKAVEEIRSSISRMERLISDLLDVARIEQEGLSLRKQEVTPLALLEELCRTFQTMVEGSSRRFECANAVELPLLCVDVDRMMQLFGNLIANAIKFSPAEGVVGVHAGPDEGGVRFTVYDSGPGIPPGQLHNVFKRYWQAKKTAHLGAGLGLTISKGIVEAHEGRIWAENRPEGGAAFHVWLPEMRSPGSAAISS